jgi:DNA polymerase elongation subunit (family B)
MKILLLDIETAPNVAYVWGLFDQNISSSHLQSSSYVLCWSAKWADSKSMMFDSIHKSKPKQMLDGIHRLLDAADVVVHYNGIKFDIPTLNKEFVQAGFRPPSPYKQVDLLRVCRYAFKFESNKLDYVSQALKIGEKVRHEGFELWVKCMAGNDAAWKRMERYNRRDVKLLEMLYRRLIPWITRHPSHGAHEDISCCPKCGSEKFQQRGYAVTNVMKYPRYQCQACGGWFRGNKSVSHNRKERMANVL